MASVADNEARRMAANARSFAHFSLNATGGACATAQDGERGHEGFLGGAARILIKREVLNLGEV